MVKTTVKTQTEIIWDNREYILNRVSSGVEKGASIREMFRVISREIGVSPSSLNVAWYGQRKHGIIPLRESTSPSAISIKSKKPKKTPTKKKVTVANSILKEVKMLTDLLTKSTLAQQEANLTMLEKISKVEHENKTLVSMLSKQLTAPKNVQGRYVVGSDSSVKYIGEPLAITNSDEKFDKLIEVVEALERVNGENESILNVRREENVRLAERNRKLASTVGDKDNHIEELENKIVSLLQLESKVKTLNTNIGVLENENSKLKGRTVLQRVMNR